MKSFLKLFFVLLATSLMFSSCTMEKRVHRPGYHVDWNGKQNKSVRQNVNEPVSERRQDVKLDEVQDESTVSANIEHLPEQSFPEPDGENAEASIDNDIIPTSEKNLLSEEDEPLAESSTTSMFNSSSPDKKVENKVQSKLNASTPEDDGGAFRVIGWVLIVLGLIFLLIISLLLGLLLMLVGLIFVIAASAGK